MTVVCCINCIVLDNLLAITDTKSPLSNVVCVAQHNLPLSLSLSTFSSHVYISLTIGAFFRIRECKQPSCGILCGGLWSGGGDPGLHVHGEAEHANHAKRRTDADTQKLQHFT